MGRFFYPIVFLIAAIGFIAGGGFEATYFNPVRYSISFAVSSPKNSANQKIEQSSNPSARITCDELGFWDRTNCDPTTYFTLWLAVFTGVLAVFTIALWFVTLGIFRDSKDSSERQQRAYVMVEGLSLSRNPQSEVGFGATVTAKNFGQTPAREVIEWAQISVRSMPNTEPFVKVDTPYPSKSVLAPGVYSTQIPTHSEISDAIKIMILMSKAAIFVCGEISYIDAFNKPRTTRYRFMCLGQGYNLGLFRQCEEGNEWT
ncbi:MAG: hypothetical protein ABI230_05340 [Aestuariivirga sp.]